VVYLGVIPPDRLGGQFYQWFGGYLRVGVDSSMNYFCECHGNIRLHQIGIAYSNT